jgi:flagellar biosynthetic protein FlhB
MSAQSLGEKTEKATPKRKRDARQKGQIFKSVEVITAFSLIAMFGVLFIFGGQRRRRPQGPDEVLVYGGHARCDERFRRCQGARQRDRSFLTIVAPVLIAAVLCGTVFNLVQVGFNFTTQAMKPKLEKISMISGFKRIFSKRTLIDLMKALIKIVLLGWVAYSEYKNRMASFPSLMGEDLKYAIPAAMKILLSVALKLGIAFAIFAPFDYMYQRWKYNKDLMMTKQEVRDEYKQTEGNPQTKSRISQKQRQMSRMRMVQAVKDADVVITNPTHYAVALSYKEGKHKAPVVIAKGKDFLAQKIKEKARELSIEIVENRPVAQSLYFFCEVGDEVPEDLYKAVAEILAYVYRLKKKTGRRA